jgi:hypothetical protein
MAHFGTPAHQQSQIIYISAFQFLGSRFEHEARMFMVRLLREMKFRNFARSEVFYNRGREMDALLTKVVFLLWRIDILAISNIKPIQIGILSPKLVKPDKTTQNSRKCSSINTRHLNTSPSTSLKLELCLRPSNLM